ncbi:hypothetical protein [Kocuria rosea]|uniref:hypothetical protein n=1 Tax=Kocuria rosea TaxID=1275 RepID=UPI00232B12EF|nr:hypothetical protein [Kocuria rosea]
MAKGFKMSKADERKLAAAAQKELDKRMAKAGKRTPIHQGDSEAEIARKLTKQLKDAGADPNKGNVRKEARRIAKGNSQD